MRNQYCVPNGGEISKKWPLFRGFYAVANKSPHCSDATLPVFTRIPQEN